MLDNHILSISIFLIINVNYQENIIIFILYSTKTNIPSAINNITENKQIYEKAKDVMLYTIYICANILFNSTCRKEVFLTKSIFISLVKIDYIF